MILCSKSAVFVFPLSHHGPSLTIFTQGPSVAGRNGSRRDPLTEITRAQVDIYGGEQIRPPDKVNSLSLSLSKWSRSGPGRAFPSCLCACTISCELELIGGRTEENQIDRSTVYVRPRINPSTIRSIPGRVGGPSGSQDNFHR